jgi:hypothetical protein
MCQRIKRKRDTIRIETNLTFAQGNISRLRDSVDKITLELFLGVAVVIIAQFISKII